MTSLSITRSLRLFEQSLEAVLSRRETVMAASTSDEDSRASGPAGQKPEEIVAGQHAYRNSVLDDRDVMQTRLHHAVYDDR